LVSILVARNRAQGILTVPVIARLTSTAVVWYTCPTGKKAHIIGYAIVNAFGAATDVHIERNPTSGDVISRPMIAGATESGIIEFDLEAGDTLGYDQNSGTNATIDGVWSVQESPA